MDLHFGKKDHYRLHAQHHLSPQVVSDIRHLQDQIVQQSQLWRSFEIPIFHPDFLKNHHIYLMQHPLIFRRNHHQNMKLNLHFFRSIYIYNQYQMYILYDKNFQELKDRHQELVFDTFLMLQKEYHLIEIQILLNLNQQLVFGDQRSLNRQF